MAWCCESSCQPREVTSAVHMPHITAVHMPNTESWHACHSSYGLLARPTSEPDTAFGWSCRPSQQRYRVPDWLRPPKASWRMVSRKVSCRKTMLSAWKNAGRDSCACSASTPAFPSTDADPLEVTGSHLRSGIPTAFRLACMKMAQVLSQQKAASLLALHIPPRTWS